MNEIIQYCNKYEATCLFPFKCKNADSENENGFITKKCISWSDTPKCFEALQIKDGKK